MTDLLCDLEEVRSSFCAQLYLLPSSSFPTVSTSLCQTWKLKHTAQCYECLCFCFILFLKGRGLVVFDIISHRVAAQGLPHCCQIEDFRHEDSLTWFSFLSFFACHEPLPHLFSSWISVSLFVQLLSAIVGIVISYPDLPSEIKELFSQFLGVLLAVNTKLSANESIA